MRRATSIEAQVTVGALAIMLRGAT